MYIIKENSFDSLENQIGNARVSDIFGYIDTTDRSIVEAWVNDKNNNTNKSKGWDGVYYPYYTFEEVKSIKEIEESEKSTLNLNDISSCVDFKDTLKFILAIDIIDDKCQYKTTVIAPNDFILAFDAIDAIVSQSSYIPGKPKKLKLNIYGDKHFEKIIPEHALYSTPDTIGPVELDYKKTVIIYRDREYDVLICKHLEFDLIYV